MISVFMLLALLSYCDYVVNAQSAASVVSTTSSTSKITTTASSARSIRTVHVGESGYEYDPNNITANSGDVIVFQFYYTGHSVIKSAFGKPCLPYDTVYRGQHSFFSGNFTDATNGLDPPTWNLTINDTSPVFFYCGAPDSCLGHHMIGVINANATFNLSQQLSFFNDQTIMLQPGEPLPAEGATVTSSSTSTTSIQTPSSSAQATPSSSASHVSLSTGSIAGIAVGVAIVFALVGALFWFMGRSRILKQSLEQARVTPNAPPPSNRLFNGNEHDSDTRWSVSYGGSTVPEKRTSQMNTVHTIDRYGSPELDGNHVSELGGVATEHPWQSRSSERLSFVASESHGEAPPEPTPKDTDAISHIHELG